MGLLRVKFNTIGLKVLRGEVENWFSCKAGKEDLQYIKIKYAMKDLNEFKSFNNALVNYFMAEQKMLYHSQVSQLAMPK
jgi:hypothetical protein